MSSSDSKTQADTTYQNSTKVLGQGSTYADNGANVLTATAYSNDASTNLSNSGNDNSTNTYLADNSSKWTDSSTTTTNTDLRNSGNTTNTLTDSGNTTTNILDGGSIDLAGRTALAAINLGNNAIDANTSTLKTGFDFGSKTLTNSINAISDSVNASLAASSAAQARASAAAESAQANAYGFASQSAAQSATAQRQALDAVLNNTSDALAYGKYETGAALDSLNTSASMVATAYADAKGRGALTDKIMMLAIAGAALVAWQAVRR
jgi:hypothetical protein